MDDSMHFRLLDLPAELRESIYKFTFSTRRADELKVPAICATSRLLRKEALPLFYRTQRFAINLLTNDAFGRAESWIYNLDRKQVPDDSLRPILLIRRWTLLLHVDCYSLSFGEFREHPVDSLTYMGVNIDLDDCVPDGVVHDIRTSAVHAWIHSMYNMYQMKALQTPLSRTAIEGSNAETLCFGEMLEDLKMEVRALWRKRKSGILEAENYICMLLKLRYFLTVHPTISQQRDLNFRELGRQIVEIDRLDSIASEFMEAIQL